MCSLQKEKGVYTGVVYVLGLPHAPPGLSWWDPPSLVGPSLKVYLQGWL